MKRQPGRQHLHPFACSLVVAALATACGGAQAPIEVTRPPLVPASAYGSTVSVSPFTAAWPDYRQVAGTLQQELAEAIDGRKDSGVRLQAFGGGVTVHGVVERYATSFVQLSRAASCTDRVEVEGEMREVVRACTYRRMRWKAWVSVQMRVKAAEGRLLYQRRIQEIRSGQTPEVRDAVPPPPDLHTRLKGLRQQIVARMARVIVPQRVRLSGVTRPCAGAAAHWCERARAHFAASHFEASLADYDRALRAIADGPNADRADVHWNRAQVARYGGDHGLAIDELETAQRLSPGDAVITSTLADVAREQREDGWLIDLGLGTLPPPRQP